MDTPKPKTKRQIQAETMRLRLQGIVERLARKMPLDDIKIQDIASEAEVSVGNFYQYFSSKEEALIYSYRYIDLEWEKLEFEKIADCETRVFTIIKAHLTSMADATLCFLAQLYISQLKIYDEYFFTPDRYLHRVLRQGIEECQRQGIFTSSYTAAELTEKFLNFSRGLVYNYCIRHKEDQAAWLEKALKESREYILFFKTSAR